MYHVVRDETPTHGEAHVSTIYAHPQIQPKHLHYLRHWKSLEVAQNRKTGRKICFHWLPEDVLITRSYSAPPCRPPHIYIEHTDQFSFDRESPKTSLAKLSRLLLHLL